jgi:hypothetical protein
MATKRVGDHEYRVYGLQGRAEEIRGAARQVIDATGTRVDAARAALVDWHGRHAATFVERVNGVLSDLVSLQLEMSTQASRCAAFPDEAAANPSFVDQYSYNGARVEFHDADPSTASAVPAKLRAYVTAASDQAGAIAGAAAKVTTDGLSADVAVMRPLTSAEAREYRENGYPANEIPTIRVWGDHHPVAVTQVFGVPDLTANASTLRTRCDELSAWVTAVAYAFEVADPGLLQLLLDHPEIAGYLAGGLLPGGHMTGEAALALVLANLRLFDTAGRGGDPDGVVGLPDLEAIANDPNQPQYLRDAARYLLGNRMLLSMASVITDPSTPYEIEPDNGRLTADGITLFLQFNQSLNAIGRNFDRLDTAAHGGDTDGYVSVNDLNAAANDMSLPAEVRAAAQFLLDHGELTQRIQLYEQANVNRMTRSYPLSGYNLTDSPSGFDRNGLIALAIDQQAFPDPAEARQFVLTLPVADAYGHGGLPITLVSDEGLRALANSSLLDARGDLTDQVAVIGHLPETTGWNGSRGAVEQPGGTRNTLINGMYDLLAKRADGIFAGDLAGHPDVPGHPGANWLMFAPWASNGVHGVITGDTTGPLGFTTSGIMQGAADGNQFIFSDIGSRYAAFIEMYEHNPRPSEATLESFFSNNFDDGDGTIRDGFAAYVAAVEEDDPVRKQQLLFQGNTLVATHEQAGVQHYLDEVAFGPDSIATDFVQLRVGGETLAVKNDVPPGPTTNNLIIPSALGSLDTGHLNAGAFVGDQTHFQVGGTPSAGVVDMAPLRGTEAFQPDFSKSTQDWWQGGTGGDRTSIDSLHGSGASSWPDWNERMNYIVHLFEQHHTDPKVFDTSPINVGFDNVGWLDPSARPHG